ncbi:hypothetical protein [Marinitoga aeolica]|uniref:Outer membrane protein beta-barrel domain-containing protein n=1 Tax=Marinitoga aeolica TaxID=2809031 RepID=A0ABY8PQV2_9BACT|nr:hypothetical protein [Marinitoga aeolica]WGS64976.1 hypothetical protein JRV97_00015 [Marinitoga aeolica]
MRKFIVFIILILSAISFSDFVKIGIYGFENKPIYNKIAESYLSKKDNVIVVDRTNLELIIEEKKLELLGIVENDEKAGEFSELANLDYLFIGKTLDNGVYYKIIDKSGKVIYSNVLKGNIEKSLRKDLSSLEFNISNGEIINVIKKDIPNTFQNTAYISFKGTLSFFEPYLGLDMGYYIIDNIALGISGELNVIGYPLSRWNIEGYTKYNFNRFYSKFGLGYHNDIYNIANTIYYLTFNPGYELNNFSIELPLKLGYNLGQLIFDPGLNLYITIKF